MLKYKSICSCVRKVNIIMRVNLQHSVHFGKACSSKGVDMLSKLCTEGKDAIGLEDDYTMFDIPSFSFYRNENEDTGRGKLNSDEALNIISTLKPYTGLNAIKDYPFGREIRHANHFYCPYNRSAITIGEDQINFSKLTTPKYGSLLDKADIKELVESNKRTRIAKNKANYENEIGTDMEYPILKPLRKAYDNFKKHHSSPDDKLNIEFEQYKNDPVSRDYDRIALYPFIHEDEPDLFENFAQSPEKQQKFEEYKEKYKDEIEFFKFRQFLAFKDKLEAKENFNKMNVDVVNDVAIGFSPEEYWAFPDAFNHNLTAGYGFFLPKYEDVTNKESELYNLLKHKLELNLRVADGLRLDVGVSYDSFRTFKKDKNGEFDYSKVYEVYDNKGIVADFIEDIVKEIKGEDFDMSKIMYEGDGDTSYIMDWKEKSVKQTGLLGKNIMYTSTYQHSDGLGWGSVKFLKEVLGLKDNEFIFGTENHDNWTLRMMAENDDDEKLKTLKDKSIPVLADELDVKKSWLKNPKNWVKAKMEELFLAKRRFFYFMDVLGKKEFINDHSVDEKERFRDRLTDDFEKEFHRELQRGNGFNYPETIAARMKKTGAAKENPALYEKLEFLGKYLRAQGALSKEEADKEVQISGHDRVLDELERIDKKYE